MGPETPQTWIHKFSSTTFDI